MQEEEAAGFVPAVGIWEISGWLLLNTHTRTELHCCPSLLFPAFPFWPRSLLFASFFILLHLVLIRWVNEHGCLEEFLLQTSKKHGSFP